MKETRLLVMSDDFGMCHGVNTGITRGFSRGILGGTNLMVPCPWFEEAVILARREKIPAGIHLTLTCDWPNFRWRPLTGPSSLTDSSGYFYPTFSALAPHARDEDIIKEYRAQIRMLRSRIDRIYHTDFHMLVPPAFLTDPFEKRIQNLGREVGREEGLEYLFGAGEGESRWFRSVYSSTGEPPAVTEAYLENLEPGDHCLITHCAEETEEISSLADPSDPVYLWTSPFRKADQELVESPGLRRLLTGRGIRLVDLNEWFRD